MFGSPQGCVVCRCLRVKAWSDMCPLCLVRAGYQPYGRWCCGRRVYTTIRTSARHIILSAAVTCRTVAQGMLPTSLSRRTRVIIYYCKKIT